MRTNQSTSTMHLDAGEAVTLARQLQFVDREQYKTLYPELLARSFFPTLGGIPEWANEYFYSMTDQVGRAKIVSGDADDYPAVDVVRGEKGKRIKDVGDSYSYTVKEIKRSQALGMNLDVERAAAARYAIELEFDRIISLGDTIHGLSGALKLETEMSITPIVAITKTGGGTNWSAAATSSEIAGDVFKLIEETREKVRMANGRMWLKYRVLMPDRNYSRLVSRRMGDGSDVSPLNFLIASPFIESIHPWWRTSGAAANNVDDRMMAFPVDPAVVGAIVTQEFTPSDPEKRNNRYYINCEGSTGGIVSKYGMPIGYMDTIDAV